jgi:paraquat-inducible protein A
MMSRSTADRTRRNRGPEAASRRSLTRGRRPSRAPAAGGKGLDPVRGNGSPGAPTNHRAPAKASQFRRHGWRVDVLAPLGLATAALTLGLILPVIHFSWALKTDTTFSVLTGIVDLLQGGHLFIGLIILVFSVIFPVTKILWLYALWFLPLPAGSRESPLRWLEFLGKWSMLDVFVVGILVGTLDLGILSEATPRVGAYVFTLAILLSMAATLRQSRRARRPAAAAPVAARPSPAVPLLALLAIFLLGAGLELPLLKVDKWIFWRNEYSVLGGTAALFREGHAPLAVIVAGFVIAAPILQAAGAVGLWVFGRSRRARAGIMAALRHVGRWAMADVFALGLAVVLTKINGVVNVATQPGIWLFVAGAMLASAVSWSLMAPPASRGWERPKAAA